MLQAVEPITPTVMAAWRVYPQFLPQLFHLVRFTLEKAEKLSDGEYTVQSLLDSIHQGTSQLWIIWDPHAKKEPDEKETVVEPRHMATFITRVVELDNGEKRVWVDFINGRKYKHWTRTFLDALRAYAKETGCSVVYTSVRQGYVKTLVEEGCKAGNVIVKMEV